MKVKRLLRFYFFADGLESAFENLILRCALSSAGSLAEDAAEKICAAIEEKEELSRLWAYIDGVITFMPCADIAALKEYSSLRIGLKSLSEERYRRLRRAVVKFTRRARRLECFGGGISAVGKYYSLIPPYLSGRT